MTEAISGKTDRYHHGHLRQALLEAALELASERGVGGFSMREVSRRAGVSHNAPYHHFADKGKMMEDLAAESFRAITGFLREVQEKPDGPDERLVALCVAYVRFAIENPTRFRFMFQPEVRQTTSNYPFGLAGFYDGVPDDQGKQVEGSPKDRAMMEAYDILVDAVVECQKVGLSPAGDPALLALTAWSTVHGLSVLLLDGPKKLMESEEALETITRVVTERLAYGLLAR